MFWKPSNPASSQDRNAPTDLELLLRTHRGHEASARVLWERHGRRLNAIAAGLLRGRGGQTAAGDVVQSVLCALLQTPRSELARIVDVSAYLARAVRNASLNHARAARRHGAHASAAGEHSAAETQSSFRTPSAGESDELGAALDRLAPHQRELIVLKHAADLTFDQMALALDENRSTVATRYAAALAKLRELMGAGLVQEGAV